MRTQLRIVSGRLRGRKLTVEVHPRLRPTPDRVREALFNILREEVPDRPFLDIFAGTGVVGLEALSRGASSVTFVERDFRSVQAIERYLEEFGVAEEATVLRADVYAWGQRYEPPAGPVNFFLSPPFADLERRPDDLIQLITDLLDKAQPGSVVVLQSEAHVPLDPLPAIESLDRRRYGRNELLIWIKAAPPE